MMEDHIALFQISLAVGLQILDFVVHDEYFDVLVHEMSCFVGIKASLCSFYLGARGKFVAQDTDNFLLHNLAYT